MRLALALVIALAGCSTERPVSGQGEGERPTIVSLNPCTDAIAAELAGPDQVLALSHYSHDPSASSIEPDLARQYAITGGTVEEILALDPDLVVADVFLQPATRRALEELGFRVEIFDIAYDVESSQEQIARMAKLLRAPEGGAALNRRIADAIRDLGEAAGQETRTAILWQPGGLVAGERALVSELLRAAGFRIHSSASELGQGGYLPLEAVLTDPPDVLILAGTTRSQTHEALAVLTQTEQARFDPALLYCGGPSIISAAKRLAEIRDESA